MFGKKGKKGEADKAEGEQEAVAPAETSKSAVEGAPIDGAVEGEGGEAPKKGKKKLFMIIGAVLVLALVGGGVMMSGILGGAKKEAAPEDENPDLKAQTIYFDMDEFLVNLNNPGSQVSFLKAVITLELPNELSHKEVQEKMPRIRDTFQVYLRELRSSDLQGSAGLQRLRTELLLRLNGIMEKGKVNNVLFKEIIVQ